MNYGIRANSKFNHQYRRKMWYVNSLNETPSEISTDIKSIKIPEGIVRFIAYLEASLKPPKSATIAARRFVSG